jgi:integrase
VTTALLPEDDLHDLPMPTADTLVVLPRWTSPGNQHANSQYGELTWSLGPLIDNPSTCIIALTWTNCPEEFRSQVKLATWAMINGELRATYLKTRGNQARARRGGDALRDTCGEWKRLARWLHKRGITDFAQCTADEWRRYVTQRWSKDCSRRHAERILGWLDALWAYDQVIPHPAGISRPPWLTEGVDDYLPSVDASSGGRENSTEPLDPQVIGPLLVWSIRMVEEFADDVLNAWAENRRMAEVAATNVATPASQLALEAYLLPLINSGGAIPATERKGETMLARRFIAASTGASLGQVDRINSRHQVRLLATERPGPCPLSVPVTGKIGTKAWREYVDSNEAADLMRHLGTAAMIICLYLTGMRPQEVQGLRSGCCPDPAPDKHGNTGRHLIRSHHYKNVTDDNGNHVSAGEEREVPWVAIMPVVRAIRALERMVPDGELLFSATHHDFPALRGNHGALKQSALSGRIEDFIAWANREARTHELADQVVPEDPHGSVGMSRFRRSLAWHIARRPGGLIALAIQYGHMRTVLDARTSTGYGSRSRTGIHGVLDVETALAAADTAAHLRDRVAAGEKVSGPAARRALIGAAQTPRFEGRIVPATFAKKAASFLARDGIVLYDNPDAFLICAFKHDNALCDPEPGATAPRQFNCRPGCGNAVRTDAHALQMRQRADEIDRLAAHAPGPLGKRLRANAGRLRETADTHDTTAQTAEVLT